MGQVIQMPNRMADREPYVTKSQVAKRYQLSTKTIERWIGMGCPSRKVQGKRVLQLSAVDAWLSQERSA